MSDVDKFVTCLIDDEDSFGVVNVDDVSAVGLAVIQGSVEVMAEREALEEDSVTQDHGQWDPVEGSAAESTFNFSTRAGGIGDITPTPDGVEGAEDTELPVISDVGYGRALLSLFGDLTAVAGDTVAASPAPLVSAFSLAGQTTLDADLVILLVETASHGLQPIPCTIVDGACTPLMEPPSAPVSGGDVWGSLNFTLNEGLELADSFQGIFISDTTGHKYRILGGFINQMVLNLTPRKLGKLDFQSRMNSWAVVTTALSAVSPPPSRPWMDATFRLADYDVNTYDADQILKCKGDLQFTFMRGLSPEDDPNHPEGASGYDEDFSDAFCKFSPILPYSESWRDNFGLNRGKAWHCLAASTRQPGRGCATYLRRVVQAEYPPKVEHNGMVRVQPSFALGSGYTQPGCVYTVF